jgi:hypothetical protein
MSKATGNDVEQSMMEIAHPTVPHHLREKILRMLNQGVMHLSDSENKPPHLKHNSRLM